MPAVKNRLSEVERQLRIHRTVIAGLLVAILAMVGFGATERAGEVIRARRIEVVDDGGRALISLEVRGGEGTITVTTTESDSNVEIFAASTGGGVVRIENKFGDLAAVMYADSSGNGQVVSQPALSEEQRRKRNENLERTYREIGTPKVK